jgi:Legume lectin domain
MESGTFSDRARSTASRSLGLTRAGGSERLGPHVTGRVLSGRRRAAVGVALCALAIAGLSAVAASAAVNYPDFSDTAGLKLNGTAAEDSNGTDEFIQLTTQASGQNGSFFTKKSVVKPAKNFKTRFQITQHDSASFAGDGMAFVIQEDSPSALGGSGGGLGYSGIDKSLIVEFDIYANFENNDPNSNHVGLMLNGDAANHLAAEDPGFALYPNAPYAWVNYKAESKKLKVYVSTGDTKPDSPLISEQVNLKKTLDGHEGYAGFTAATGDATAVQSVLSWKLKSG